MNPQSAVKRAQRVVQFSTSKHRRLEHLRTALNQHATTTAKSASLQARTRDLALTRVRDLSSSTNICGPQLSMLKNLSTLYHQQLRTCSANLKQLHSESRELNIKNAQVSRALAASKKRCEHAAVLKRSAEQRLRLALETLEEIREG